MPESTSEYSLRESTEDELEYRSVDPWAVAGLVGGIVSSVAMLDKILWLVPPFAVLVNIVALRRLKANPARLGRTAALAGVALSFLFAVAPLVQSITTLVLLQSQGRPIADQFLEYLREDSPQKAMMLEYAPDSRQPIDEHLWDFYRTDHAAAADLKSFVREPVVRTLLELGPRADVRFYRTDSVATNESHAQVEYWYAVTYDDNGQKTTFLISVLVDRKPTKRPGLYPWRVKRIAAGIDADGSQ